MMMLMVQGDAAKGLNNAAGKASGLTASASKDQVQDITLCTSGFFFMCIHACLCVFMHVSMCVHVCLCTFMPVYVYLCLSMCVHVCLYVYSCLSLCVFMSVSISIAMSHFSHLYSFALLHVFHNIQPITAVLSTAGQILPFAPSNTSSNSTEKEVKARVKRALMDPDEHENETESLTCCQKLKGLCDWVEEIPRQKGNETPTYDLIDLKLTNWTDAECELIYPCDLIPIQERYQVYLDTIDAADKALVCACVCMSTSVCLCVCMSNFVCLSMSVCM